MIESFIHSFIHSQSWIYVDTRFTSNLMQNEFRNAETIYLASKQYIFSCFFNNKIFDIYFYFYIMSKVWKSIKFVEIKYIHLWRIRNLVQWLQWLLRWGVE